MKIQKYQKGNVLNPYIQEWSNQWKERMQPSASSKVLLKWNASGRKPKPETSQERTNRRIKEETKRTWRSNAADIAHGIGEAALSFHPYTAIPYFGAKVGQDILNGNVGWQTAVNASIPLFHLSPQAVGLKEATNVALEDAANTGSKTTRNWRVAREINQATKSKPNISNRTISVKRSNNEITGQPDLVYTLYNEFGEPIGLTNIGGAVFGSGNKTHRMVDGVMSMRNAHKVSEDTYNAAIQDIIDNGGKGLESGWSLMMPQKTLAVTSKFPHTVIGLEFGNPVRLLTGTSKRPIPQRVLGNHYLELKPSFEIKYNESTGNFEQIPISNSEPYVSTSLKFFERKPSRISLVEREGIPKGDRNLPFKRKQLTEHVLGNEAVKMFKEYGGEPIPEGSINGELLRKYVAEARERYGLVNNANITDEEIAQSLYKHSKELGGNTAAVNSQGEPQLLFRGDTRRYTQLKERMSPEELATKKGTMDNSLGNLFLGEFPDSYRGVDRYIGTWRNFNGSPRLIGSGTGSKVVWDGKIGSEIEGYPYLGPLAGGGYKLYSQPHRYGNIDVYKLPASMMESGVNDLNAFIVRTPLMRNASSEISVLNDDWMLQGAKDSHFMSKNYKYNPKTDSMENIKTGESLGEITTESAPESRVAMGDHYKELLKEAKQKLQGLLKSEANSSLRDEHSLYSYFALPNFNIQGAKHLLPYDLRIPRNWKDKNIYRGLVPLTTGYTLYNLFNQPKQQLLYLKQGGKIIKKALWGTKIKDGKENARLSYLNWSKLSWADLMKRRLNIAKSYLNNGPAILNIGNAVYAAFGGRDPKNPDLTTGIAPSAGIKNANSITKVVKNSKVTNPSIIQSYKTVIPRFIKKVKEFNGSDKFNRTVNAAIKLVNPSYTKTLAKSPELVEHIPLYNFKNFNTNQLNKFQKVWASEASKAPFSLEGRLKHANTPDQIEKLPKYFQEARKILEGINLSGRYAKLLSRKYLLMYELITDPTLKHIADVSPQYIPELLQQLSKFGGATEDFVRNLIKQSNSYRRIMSKPSTVEDFKTFKGSGLIKGEGSQINVEGRVRSDFNGEYGKYPGYYEGLPNLKGDVSTWWDQRIPEGIQVKEGVWTENNVIHKLRNKLNRNYSDYTLLPAELEFWRNYSAPNKFINWPTHLVFFGAKNSKLQNFNVSTTMPKDFVFSKGYKKGGSIYIKPSKRCSFTRWCGGKVTNECILKGKNSSNPAIRKKAVFAQNVRKFKH